VVLCKILFQDDKLVETSFLKWKFGIQKGAWQEAPVPEREATQTVPDVQRIFVQAAQPEPTGLIQGHPIHYYNRPLT
jgi:hypothetical protein